MIDLSPFWLFLIFGVGLLAIEIAIFQFSTFWLFYIGVGALIAAGVAWFMPEASYAIIIGVFLIASIAATALMHIPLMRWQNKPPAMSDNNAIGERVVVTSEIGVSKPGTVSWSGSDWQAELPAGENATISKGDNAIVVSVSGIRLFVKPETA